MLASLRLLLSSVSRNALVAAIPVSGVASTPSYNFTIDNALQTSNQAGLLFPSGATTTPNPSSKGWFFGLAFTVPMAPAALTTFYDVIAHSGAAINYATGLTLAYTQAGNATPLQLRMNFANTGVSVLSASPLVLGTVTRGHSYWFCLGQLSSSQYMVAVYDITAGSWLYGPVTGTTGAQYNNAQLVKALGCAGGMSSGNANGFSGCVANTFMLSGSSGFAMPSTATLLSIATGAYSVAAWATSIGATYQYYCACAGPGNLAADAAGTITAAMTPITTTPWVPNVTAIVGDPIIGQPWLTLISEAGGNYYVWGLVKGATSGKVWFRGVYSTKNGATPKFEVLLTRKDGLGTVGGFGVWTPLLGVVASGGLYSGYVYAPAGVGFSRAIRYAGNAATAYYSAEKHAVGLVIGVNAQSQAYGLFSITSNGNTGSSNTAVTPTDTNNSFGVVLRLANGLSDVNPPPPYQTNSPLGDFANFRPILPSSTNYVSTTYGVSAVGDGILAMLEKLRALTSLPVMIYDITDGGHSPGDFYSDRQTVVWTSVYGNNGWTGNTTTFSITLASATGADLALYLPFMNGQPNSLGGYWPTPTQMQYGVSSNGVSSPMIIAGTLTGTLTIGGNVIPLADNGSGTLSGSNGGVTVTGTINYSGTTTTFPSLSLTTSTAVNAASATLSLSWVKISDYIAASNTPKATPNGFTMTGTLGTLHTGISADIYAAMWKNQVTAIIFPWWTTLLMDAYSGVAPHRYSDFQALHWPVLDALRYWHKQVPNVAGAHFFFAPAARECPGSGTSELASSYGGHRQSTYAYVAANPTDCHLLADMNDATTWGGSNQGGPHEDWAGYQSMGQRYAVSIAAGLGYGSINLYSGSTVQPAAPAAPVLGPVLTSVTRASSTSLLLTYALPNGTALSPYKLGNGTTITGFEVGVASGTQGAAFAARVIASGTITSNSGGVYQITISGLPSMTGKYVSLSYCAGYNVFTGTGNYVADAATLQNLLCDNSGGYTLPVLVTLAGGSGIGPAAGNGAQSVLDWAA